MEKTKHGWSVLDRDAGVLSYEYSFNGSGSTSNAFAARLPDGKMMVISPPVRTSEGAFEDLLQFGDVGALVANNGFHHLGQPEWRNRFPNARAFAAPETAKRIQKKSPGLGEFEPMSRLTEILGANVGVVEAPATRFGETWGWANVNNGRVWFASDVIANIPKLPSNFFFALLFKWTGSAPGFRVFNFAVKLYAKDKQQFLGKILEDIRENPPTVIVPSHGDVIAADDVAAQADRILSAAL